MNLLENASAGTNVIMVSCGIDGVPTHLKGWGLFLQNWEDQKELTVTIYFAKREEQWYGAEGME